MPSPVMPPATPQPAAEGGDAAIAPIGLVVGLLVIIGVVVKVFDLKQKRESEAVQLQAQLSDALLREPSLAGLPLTPTVDRKSTRLNSSHANISYAVFCLK